MMKDYPIQSIALADCLNLRRDILWPAATLQDCIEDGDEDATHYGYLIEGKVISCLSVFYRTPKRYQIRKFATDTKFQNQGIGTMLFTSVLQHLLAKHVETVYLNARSTATRFYEKFKFQPFDQAFVKKNVTFLPMELNLLTTKLEPKKLIVQ